MREPEMTDTMNEEEIDELLKSMAEKCHIEEPEILQLWEDTRNPIPRTQGRVKNKPIKNSVGFMYGPIRIKRK